MTNTNPNPDINLAEISTRNTHARHIVVGCASALPSLADMWQALDDALADGEPDPLWVPPGRAERRSATR